MSATLTLPLTCLNPVAPDPLSRFTLDGSASLERHLARACENVLDGVRELVPARRLEGLMLGGGYGRGEGGVLETPQGDCPYNDLEFYVLIRGNRWLNERRYLEPLHRLAHQLAPMTEAELEFKITSSSHLRRSPPSMFYYDLLLGHKWLWGDPQCLAGCAHHHAATAIPLAEATRLLMNRGTGLLFAREKLSRQPLTGADADFVSRNLAKTQLALGDTVLAAFGQYHWSCRQRHTRLLALESDEPLPWLDEVRRHHAYGLDFKLRPRRPSVAPADLERLFRDVSALGLPVWLWLEARRLGHPFQSVRDYALSYVNKCPETNPWRNLLVNAKAFGPASLWQPNGRRYPRERLLNSLPILLWEESAPDSELTRRLQIQLQTPTTVRADFIQAYQSLSARLNGSAQLSS